MVTEIVIILILIILNGILSASEIAIVSSRKARLRAVSTKNNGAKMALKLKENPNNFLSTVQIGITLIGILTGFFSGGTISVYLADVFSRIDVLAPYSSQLAVVLVVLVVSVDLELAVEQPANRDQQAAEQHHEHANDVEMSHAALLGGYWKGNREPASAGKKAPV